MARAIFERVGKAAPVQVVGGLSVAQAKTLARAGLRAFVISGNLGQPDGRARYDLAPAEIERYIAGFIAEVSARNRANVPTRRERMTLGRPRGGSWQPITEWARSAIDCRAPRPRRSVSEAPEQLPRVAHAGVEVLDLLLAGCLPAGSGVASFGVPFRRSRETG